MAVEFQTSETTTRGSVYGIATQDIVIDAENNGRHILPDITWLIEDIRKNGQHTPCQVRKDGGKPVMVDGHSRWRAICEINNDLPADKRLKVWCVTLRGNEVDGLLAGFQQNRLRNALTPVDEGYFISRMLKFGRTVADVAALIHEDESWCKQRLALLQLTPEAQGMVPQMKLTAAVALSKLAAAEQRRFLKSGAKITASAIKQAAHPNGNGRPATKPSVTLAAVREKLRLICEDGVYPTEDLKERCEVATSESAVDALCVWLMEVIDGTSA